MDQNHAALEKMIHKAFKGVSLGKGISWCEADVLDDYGSQEERELARAKDEKEDWTAIPFSHIGNRYYQCVLSFLDALGLRFYLPICMLYTLKHHQNSSSVICESFLFSLSRQSTVQNLKTVLNEVQITCVIAFLNHCKSLESFEFEQERIELALKEYW